MNIKTALISVSNKKNLHKLAPFLISKGVEIISTGGTLKYLKQHNIPVTNISDFTEMPEMMGGRLKTLHPKIHGGILGRRDVDIDVMAEHNITPIDLVVVNLYDFESAISTPGCTKSIAIEHIDIGGPAMIRSAAKNHQDVYVLVDPTDYEDFMHQYNNDEIQLAKLRVKYAQKVFAHTSEYDKLVSEYLYYSMFGIDK